MTGFAKLTKTQAELVEWALDPMADHWCEESEADARGGACYGEHALPWLEGQTVTVSHCPVEIVEDLLYRLEEQMPSMADAEGRPQTVAMSLRTAAKIRAAYDAQSGER